MGSIYSKHWQSIPYENTIDRPIMFLYVCTCAIICVCAQWGWWLSFHAAVTTSRPEERCGVNMHKHNRWNCTAVWHVCRVHRQSFSCLWCVRPGYSLYSPIKELGRGKHVQAAENYNLWLCVPVGSVSAQNSASVCLESLTPRKSSYMSVDVATNLIFYSHRFRYPEQYYTTTKVDCKVVCCVVR